MIRCMTLGGVARSLTGRQSISIPVFDESVMKHIQALCGSTSQELTDAFTTGSPELDRLLPQTTFADCNRGDVLCMLFHLTYPRTAERLVRLGVLSPFPDTIDDAWGFYGHWK